MLKTNLDLFLAVYNETTEGSLSVYQNEFYALTVSQDVNKVITEAFVSVASKKDLPVISVYYDNSWCYNITYPQISMSVNQYEGIGSEYANNCTRGQVSAQVIVDKLNELESIMLLEAQRLMIEQNMREDFLLDIQNPISGEDSSHWRDKVWLPKKHHV